MYNEKKYVFLIEKLESVFLYFFPDLLSVFSLNFHFDSIFYVRIVIMVLS